ncbi:MAG: hypothetical protein JSV52_04145 [Candidatus Zixiibacteriota bacterium]|nr:MAG: hypothetical protein JSV52_04145 [candidate division Zixibacteria bacterium]
MQPVNKTCRGQRTSCKDAPAISIHKHSPLVWLVALLSLLLLTCGFPEKVGLDDERVIPLLGAMDITVRDSLGFPDISDTASVYLEGAGNGYDAMLHVDEGLISRTVAFRLIDSKFEWAGEQLMYWGPEDYETVDGKMKEHITMTYEAGPESISGYPIGRLHMDYTGNDPRLASKSVLGPEDIEPVIREWAHQR